MAIFRTTLFALLLPCLFIGKTTAQVHCAPTSFSATSFDTSRFSPFRVIHNAEAERTMYTSLVDGSIRLFDDTEELLYERYTDGTCVQFNNTRGQVPIGPALVSVQPDFQYTGQDGTELLGYTIDTGFFKAALLISRTKCRLVSVRINSGGKLLLSNFNTGHEDIQPTDRQEMQETLAKFEASDCPTFSL